MRFITHLIYALLALIYSAAALPTLPNFDSGEAYNSSLTHPHTEKRYTKGRCSFQATISQGCRGKSFGGVSIKLRAFLDGEGKSITGLHSEPTMFDPHYIEACAYNQYGDSCSLLAMHGFDGKDMRMKGYRWRSNGGYWFKMTYEFDGCQWDADNSKEGYPNRCDNYCDRGSWTRSDDFCRRGDSQRTHDMTCHFRC